MQNTKDDALRKMVCKIGGSKFDPDEIVWSTSVGGICVPVSFLTIQTWTRKGEPDVEALDLQYLCKHMRF